MSADHTSPGPATNTLQMAVNEADFASLRQKRPREPTDLARPQSSHGLADRSGSFSNVAF